MNDYRARTRDEHVARMNQGPESLWAASDKLPDDHPGLMAMLHPAVWLQNLADTTLESSIACALAKAMQTKVYVICTEERWVVIGVYDGDWPPERPGDRVIASYSPTGEYKLLGAS